MEQKLSVNLKPLLSKNDKAAKIIIGLLSVVVFLVVVSLGKFKPLIGVEFSFDRFIFAKIIAVINSLVSVLLILGLYFVKQKNITAHRNTMLAALTASALFLVFYIIHHMANADTHFGGTGAIKIVYYVILVSHIILAACILPFILFTAYRGLTSEFAAHKKIARYTFPLWLYVSVTGVIVYLFISPYYA
jgi:putative membrane protein